MVKLKQIKASTLPEVIISMMIATFLFGFIAWSLVSMDQRKSIDKDLAIFLFHLNTESTQLEVRQHLKEFGKYNVEITQSTSKLNTNLIEKTIVIRNKNMKNIYSFKLLLLKNKNEDKLSN